MTTSEFPYVRFYLKFRVNPRWMARLEAAGVRKIVRGQQRQDQLKTQHAGHRGNRHYMRSGGRTDATGQVMGDSGRPIFGWDRQGTPYDAICLEKVLLDMQKDGAVMSDVHILQKDRDRMGNLVLVMSREGTPVDLDEEALKLLDTILDSSYGHLHGFNNPDGTGSMNASHRFTKPLTEAVDPRMLRFAIRSNKPSFRCEKRKVA